jgi:hypothetical protein
MSKKTFVALLLVGATVLGMTVLREPLAQAAQAVSADIVGPLDANGNIKVHEQGIANVKVANLRSEPVQVNVTNTSVPVEQAGEPVTIEMTFDDYEVPANKLLVLQYVNGIMFGVEGGSTAPRPLGLAVDDPGDAPGRKYYFAGETYVFGQKISRSISEPLTIYAKAGTTLYGDDAFYSGYLLDD